MIVVTGLIRSGTSPLAQMLHQMGVPMGHFQRFPLLGPYAHFEWEDAALAEPLLQALIECREASFRGYFLDYINRRVFDPVHQGVVAWGVKTPYILPFLKDWYDAADDAGQDVRLVVTQREYQDTIKSLKRQYAYLPSPQREVSLNVCARIQGILWKELLGVGAGTVFNIKDTWNDPEGTARRLAEIAGVECDPVVASRGIHGGTV